LLFLYTNPIRFISDGVFLFIKKLKLKIMKKGWIKSIRQSKGLTFITITDGLLDHQLTLKDGEHQLEGELKVGASFIAEGQESVTPRGLPEFVVSKMTIVGKSDDEYPIQPKAHSDDFLRTIPDMRGRAKKFQATWKIRHHLTQEIHKFFDKEDIYLYTPALITDADCEGAGETFDVKSDWLEAKLTVSSQLYGEVGARSLGKIYTFGPCFRAEKSATRKHMAEFQMVEPEISWYHLKDIIPFTEKFVKRIISGIISKSKYEFDQLGITSEHLLEVIQKDWMIISYDEICKIFGIKWGEDIRSETEQKIVTHFGVPTFITHYPKEIKPFYMHKDERVAYCFDLIFPEVGELVGGSERESSYEILEKSMTDAGLDMDRMSWYLDLRRWGSVPTSGFGLGFDRLLMFITKASKIHDVTPFPVSF
jgi:asparaginyl-tRNA synthetase